MQNPISLKLLIDQAEISRNVEPTPPDNSTQEKRRKFTKNDSKSSKARRPNQDVSRENKIGFAPKGKSRFGGRGGGRFRLTGSRGNPHQTSRNDDELQSEDLKRLASTAPVWLIVLSYDIATRRSKIISLSSGQLVDAYKSNYLRPYTLGLAFDSPTASSFTFQETENGKPSELVDSLFLSSSSESSSRSPPPLHLSLLPSVIESFKSRPDIISGFFRPLSFLVFALKSEGTKAVEKRSGGMRGGENDSRFVFTHNTTASLLSSSSTPLHPLTLKQMLGEEGVEGEEVGRGGEGGRGQEGGRGEAGRDDGEIGGETRGGVQSTTQWALSSSLFLKEEEGNVNDVSNANGVTQNGQSTAFHMTTRRMINSLCDWILNPIQLLRSRTCNGTLGENLTFSPSLLPSTLRSKGIPAIKREEASMEFEESARKAMMCKAFEEKAAEVIRLTAPYWTVVTYYNRHGGWRCSTNVDGSTAAKYALSGIWTPYTCVLGQRSKFPPKCWIQSSAFLPLASLVHVLSDTSPLSSASSKTTGSSPSHPSLPGMEHRLSARVSYRPASFEDVQVWRRQPESLGRLLDFDSSNSVEAKIGSDSSDSALQNTSSANARGFASKALCQQWHVPEDWLERRRAMGCEKRNGSEKRDGSEKKDENEKKNENENMIGRSDSRDTKETEVSSNDSTSSHMPSTFPLSTPSAPSFESRWEQIDSMLKPLARPPRQLQTGVFRLFLGERSQYACTSCWWIRLPVHSNSPNESSGINDGENEATEEKVEQPWRIKGPFSGEQMILAYINQLVDDDTEVAGCYIGIGSDIAPPSPSSPPPLSSPSSYTFLSTPPAATFKTISSLTKPADGVTTCTATTLKAIHEFAPSYMLYRSEKSTVDQNSANIKKKH